VDLKTQYKHCDKKSGSDVYKIFVKKSVVPMIEDYLLFLKNDRAVP